MSGLMIEPEQTLYLAVRGNRKHERRVDTCLRE